MITVLAAQAATTTTVLLPVSVPQPFVVRASGGGAAGWTQIAIGALPAAVALLALIANLWHQRKSDEARRIHELKLEKEREAGADRHMKVEHDQAEWEWKREQRVDRYEALVEAARRCDAAVMAYEGALQVSLNPSVTDGAERRRRAAQALGDTAEGLRAAATGTELFGDRAIASIADEFYWDVMTAAGLGKAMSDGSLQSVLVRLRAKFEVLVDAVRVDLGVDPPTPHPASVGQLAE